MMNAQTVSSEIPPNELSAWQKVTSMIFNAGHAVGFDEGYSKGINRYSIKWRIAAATIEWGLGLVMGIVIGLISGVFFF